MSFMHPFWLIFAILALLLAWVMKQKRVISPFHPQIILQSSTKSYFLLPVVVALLFIALAKPVIIKPQSSELSLEPLFIAIDFSNSMRATDVKPNRLAVAKAKAKEIIEASPMPIALIAFTTNPLLLSPPTTDKEALLQALGSINQEAILTKGTDFKKLLEFVGKFEGKKRLLIISDGGDFTDLHQLQAIAKAKNIELYTMGIGTKEGALIPTDSGYLKQNGKLVVSRLNPLFAKLGKEIEEIDELSDIDKKEKMKHQKEIQLYYIPLLLAFLLYVHIHTTLFAKFLPFMALFLFLSPLQGGMLEEYKLQKGYELLKQKHYKEAIPYLQGLRYLEARFGLGVALCALGKVDDALKLFRSISSREKEIKAKIYYNIGICYEKKGKIQAALQNFLKSYALREDSKSFAHIQKLIFKKPPKKVLLPFAKQKISPKKSSKDDGKKQKSAGGANINLAIAAGNAKGGKRQKGASLKGTNSIPQSSRLYELINKGYMDEKNPW